MDGGEGLISLGDGLIVVDPTMPYDDIFMDGGWWPVFDENGKYIKTCTSEGCTSSEEDVIVMTAPKYSVEITVPQDSLTVVQVVQSGDSTEPIVIYADQTDPELPALIIVDTGITDPSDVSIDVS
jgi:hypothetical protein